MAHPRPSSRYDFDFEAAARVPENILLGSSSWTYPGWKDLVYFEEYKNQKDLVARSLAEYSRFPLFRTVEVDRTFYAPPAKSLLESYASMVPPAFRWISKVWERLTIPTYPRHARYGKHAGQANPDFLNPEVFTRQVLPPYTVPGIREHVGPFVFQFPTISKTAMSPDDFFKRLDQFLGALPKEFLYATEIRNPEFLVPEYFETLNAHGATHCFNHWNYMPSLREQMKSAAQAGGLTANHFVARILTPHGISYEKAVKLFEPYETIQRPNPEMRKDIATFAHRVIERGATAFVIVNNRAEGNSPMTIDALGKLIIGR